LYLRIDIIMKVIGLTGGIGSGKSTVAGFLAEFGAAVIDLDKVGHEALMSEGKAYRQVLDAFGRTILTRSGEIDRAKLGNIVFNDPNALLRLNSIVHPVIDRIVAEKTEDCRCRDFKAVVFEAAAMLEGGKTFQFDELWVTVAPENTVLDRLGKRSGYSEKESRARINAQFSNQERIKNADVVIDTDCTLDELKLRVLSEWQKLQKRL
jgi:dephospho-CoA kinase